MKKQNFEGVGPAAGKPIPTSPPTFSSDFRVENPGLHRLYVSYALETMEITARFMTELYDLSRWPASHMATLIAEEQREHIANDAAWSEAAAILYSHTDVSAWRSANLPEPQPVDDRLGIQSNDESLISLDKAIDRERSRSLKSKKKVSSTPIPKRKGNRRELFRRDE